MMVILLGVNCAIAGGLAACSFTSALKRESKEAIFSGFLCGLNVAAAIHTVITITAGVTP